MKKTLLSVMMLSMIWLSSCGNSSNKVVTLSEKQTISRQIPDLNKSGNAENSELNSVLVSGQVVVLTKAMFLEKVYDYEKNPAKWSFKGDKACVIDFYADWCRPCKMVAPIMEELAEKYKGQITIYKVNTDNERELSQFFGIRSIPTVLFCPVNSDPQMTQGALPKDTFEKIISETLLNKK